MIRTLVLALAAASLLPAPLWAQDQSDFDANMQAATQAQEIAQLMGEVQIASALAQAQYAGMTVGNTGPGYQGAIALPTEIPDVWLAVIVGKRSDAPDADYLALAEYEVSGGRIISEIIHPTDAIPLLDGPASAMAQARSFAPRAVLASGQSAFCAAESGDGAVQPSVTFATIVLPPRSNGTFDAYVLNGPIEEGAIPLGKHFRVGFDSFGLDGEPELVTDTCEVVTWDTADTDLAMSVYVTEYEGANAPSPVHIYVSGLLPMSMGVVTGEMIWPMAGGMIAPPVPAAEAGYVSGE
ncbi:hypothetical protein [Aurantiacibacter marinus]|uniref:Uncharacterized protein n=1 Tax=Aurantiacibacter marinus TaxID=874156 RepID=A0A0H0XNI3_9SPHN|nr:hypothetical protein [Aurantiacibacter marinus]KLI64178.1 hypothetical protein AAV99_00400 [Aurantiacibacter marinus]